MQSANAVAGDLQSYGPADHKFGSRTHAVNAPGPGKPARCYQLKIHTVN
jgi:hypothetical protein